MKLKMTHLQNRLVNYLKEYCYGRDRAISKDRLARYFDITTRELRDLKRDIVMNYAIPIGSTKVGYFYPANDLEIMQFRKYCLKLAGAHLEMQKAYENIINQKDQLQMI